MVLYFNINAYRNIDKNKDFEYMSTSREETTDEREARKQAKNAKKDKKKARQIEDMKKIEGICKPDGGDKTDDNDYVFCIYMSDLGHSVKKDKDKRVARIDASKYGNWTRFINSCPSEKSNITTFYSRQNGSVDNRTNLAIQQISETGEFGVFAMEHIKKGVVLGIYSGLVKLYKERTDINIDNVNVYFKTTKAIEKGQQLMFDYGKKHKVTNSINFKAVVNAQLSPKEIKEIMENKNNEYVLYEACTRNTPGNFCCNYCSKSFKDNNHRNRHMYSCEHPKNPNNKTQGNVFPRYKCLNPECPSKSNWTLPNGRLRGKFNQHQRLSTSHDCTTHGNAYICNWKDDKHEECPGFQLKDDMSDDWKIIMTLHYKHAHNHDLGLELTEEEKDYIEFYLYTYKKEQLKEMKGDKLLAILKQWRQSPELLAILKQWRQSPEIVNKYIESNKLGLDDIDTDDISDSFDLSSL